MLFKTFIREISRQFIKFVVVKKMALKFRSTFRLKSFLHGHVPLNLKMKKKNNIRLGVKQQLRIQPTMTPFSFSPTHFQSKMTPSKWELFRLRTFLTSVKPFLTFRMLTSAVQGFDPNRNWVAWRDSGSVITGLLK